SGRDSADGDGRLQGRLRAGRLDHDRRAARGREPRPRRLALQHADLQRHCEHDDAARDGRERAVGGRRRRHPVRRDRRRTELRRSAVRGTTIRGGYTPEMAANEDGLVQLGLTSYESKAYLALMRRDSATAADVARLARVPRQRIYDVLATLVQKGLVSQRPGQPAKYSAVSPEFAVERLLL